MFVLFPLSYLKMVFFTVDFNDKKNKDTSLKRQKHNEKPLDTIEKKEMLYKIFSTVKSMIECNLTVG